MTSGALQFIPPALLISPFLFSRARSLQHALLDNQHEAYACKKENSAVALRRTATPFLRPLLIAGCVFVWVVLEGYARRKVSVGPFTKCRESFMLCEHGRMSASLQIVRAVRHEGAFWKFF
jgi:hypothetical protein